MKKASKTPDEVKPEYNFSLMTGGVRGKYATQYSQGVNIVRLDEDVFAFFPEAKTVNDAHRSLIRIEQNKGKHA